MIDVIGVDGQKPSATDDETRECSAIEPIGDILKKYSDEVIVPFLSLRSSPIFMHHLW